MLTRQRADVSKLMYHMRINGDFLDHDLLASFDGRLRASVSACLCGYPGRLLVAGHHGSLLWRLGLRTALGAALPAFVASRIMCRPLVSTMAFGAPSHPIMAEYDTRPDEAPSRLVSTLPAAVAQDLVVQFSLPLFGKAYTALDISICSPHAQASPDCTQSRLAAKRDHDGPHL